MDTVCKEGAQLSSGAVAAGGGLKNVSQVNDICWVIFDFHLLESLLVVRTYRVVTEGC